MEILVMFYFILGPLLIFCLPLLIGSGFKGKRLPFPVLAFVAVALALALTPVVVGAAHIALLVPWWMGNSSAWPEGADLFTAIAGCAGLEFLLLWIGMQGTSKSVKSARVRIVTRSGDKTTVLAEPEATPASGLASDGCHVAPLDNVAPSGSQAVPSSDLSDYQVPAAKAAGPQNESATTPLEIGPWSLDEAGSEVSTPKGADTHDRTH